VVDLDVRGKKLQGCRYRLLPVFADLLPADPEMSAHIRKVRMPFEKKLAEPLAVTEGLLYRRGNFTGTIDQVILDALMEAKGAEIAFSPGFRWGTTMLPGQTITMGHVMDQTAVTYPYVTVNELTGSAIKNLLEDVADNLFNPDPYYQQGGDMVRVGGMRYRCDPAQKIGARISGMMLNERPVDAGKTYKVASWAPVAEGASGEPAWEVVARYLRSRKVLKPVTPNRPVLIGVDGNPGLS
jgi:sulfur-oxidizing protein SoxB